MPQHGVRPTRSFTPEQGLTKQSFKTETDINQIIRRYDRDGVITHLRDSAPQFLDVSTMPDYRTALNTVLQIEEIFLDLPSAVRTDFDNDPALFLDYVTTAPQAEVAERLDGVLTAAGIPGAITPRPEAPEASEAPPEPSNDD